MEQKNILKGLVQLGKLMVSLGQNKEWEDFSLGVTSDEYLKLQTTINRQVTFNGWFTPDNVRQSILALGKRLNEIELQSWVSSYRFADTPKNIGIIMAGNIPLVGFHDFLCVLVSGNRAVCKLSSDDKTLLPALAEHLIEFEPGLKARIEFSSGKIGEIDAVIATGSDNSLQYFKQYFGKYPHIFRKNRTSIAVFSGDETKEEIEEFGKDVFSYFGLGCRNVSHMIIPEGFKLDRFFEGVIGFSEVINNNKYGNNYDYNKTVYLMNQHALLDNNFVLLRESKELFSPLAMLHYHYYSSSEEIEAYLSEHKEGIQVVIGKNRLSFGLAQAPALNDYADGVDTMAWLEKLS